MKKRYILIIITALLVTMASAQKLTITTSSGSKQYSAADITTSSPATFSNNGTKMNIGSNTYTVSDIVSALVTCENKGFVTTTCSECNGDTHCATCHGTGKGCKTCNGTGKYCSSCGKTGKDQSCNGTGRCSTCGGTGKHCWQCGGDGRCQSCKRGECDKCDGSGKMECSDCHGNGKCRQCAGNGIINGVQCTACRGTTRCNNCDGYGTQTCYKCHGDGRCDVCDGDAKCYACHGDPTCNTCQGNKYCKTCGGSGTCTKCNGQPKCSTCGGDGHCAKCHNSDGICTTCNGLGYTWTDIVLSNTSLDFSYLGESKYVSISINQSWKATCSASWITLNDAEGKNSGKLTITADANPSEDSRTSTIIISHGGKTSYISITQEGVQKILKVEPNKLDFGRHGGSLSVSVTSDTDWSVSTDVSWITLSKSRGNGNDEIKITATDNSGNARNGTVTFTHKNLKATVKVSQEAVLYIPFEIENVIVMNTDYNGNIINMERDGFYASTVQYLSDRIKFKVKTYGSYRMIKKWYLPGSSEPHSTITWYNLNLSSYYDYSYYFDFTPNWYVGEWKPGNYKWEYYYEDELIYTKTFTVH